MGLLAPIMGASARNDVIKAFMDYYENRVFINKDGTCYNTPNTHALEPIAYNFGFRYKNTVQICKDGIVFYPNTVFGNNIGHYNESQYALHFCTLSWYQKPKSIYGYVKIKFKNIYKYFKRKYNEIDLVDKLIDNTIQMLENKNIGSAKVTDARN